METQEVIICKPIKEGRNAAVREASIASSSTEKETSPKDSESIWSRIEQTYTQSFPESERRPFPLVRRLVEENPAFTVYALFTRPAFPTDKPNRQPEKDNRPNDNPPAKEEGKESILTDSLPEAHPQYAGFLTAWDFNDFIYLEHFAIDEAARNGGIGGKALKQFLASCRVPIVLEVEIPTDDLSKRRIGFYERLGFQLDTHLYYQPPYRQGGPTLEMRLMTYGDLPLSASFEAVKTTLYKNVYGVQTIE